MVAGIDDKRNRHEVVHVVLKILTELRHVLEQLVLRRQHAMVFKMINQILLAVFAQEIKPDPRRYWRPLEMI